MPAEYGPILIPRVALLGGHVAFVATFIPRDDVAVWFRTILGLVVTGLALSIDLGMNFHCHQRIKFGPVGTPLMIWYIFAILGFALLPTYIDHLV